MNAVATLSFQSTTFDIVDRNGQPWLRLPQIGAALGYARGHKVQQVYERNAAEFTDSMTAVVKLPDLVPQSADAGMTAVLKRADLLPQSGATGQMREVRIFSLRGAHLLGMFARTKVAADFRRWVLDVLDRETAAMPYSIAPGQTLSADEAQSLRDLLENFAQSMPRDLQAQIMRQGWSKLKAHFKTDYRHIPAARYTEAVSILSRHIAQWAPADPKKSGTLDVSDAPAMAHARKIAVEYFDDFRDAIRHGRDWPRMGEIPQDVLEGMIAEAVMNQRLMVHFDRSTGKPVARLIPHDVCVAPVADWAGIITESDGPRFDDETLVNIASACFGRMAQRAEVRRIGNENLQARQRKPKALPVM